MPTPNDPATVLGGPGRALGPDEITRFVHDRLDTVAVDGLRVCVLIPDATRTCPLPLLLDAVHGSLHGRVAKLTVLVALGTHAAMPPDDMARHVGAVVGGLHERFPGTEFLNHRWQDPATFVTVGSIGADRVAEISGGLLHHAVEVRINRAVVDHDLTLIVGPVFPHEVVGFSGGNKYLFPGVSGSEMIDVSHWIGALISSAEIIGTLGTTPVRALIDEAAALVPGDRLALCVVTNHQGGLDAVAFGDAVSAWRAAAEVAAETHVTYLDEPVTRVLSILPERYADMWTGAKGFYKVEPVVSDGGQVVIYAPHISQISELHPRIAEIGYHCRDYFLKQWDRFSPVPWGDLAHSTHLRGAGTYHPSTGETNRVTVTLATSIPEAEVRAVNLDHLDLAEVDVDVWAADPDTLVVHGAGEHLFRLR